MASDYREEIESWRAAYERRLLADEGWLSAAGLFWLEQGENRFGSDPACDIRLPPGRAAAVLGALHLEGEVVRLQALPGVPLRVGSRFLEDAVLELDRHGNSESIALAGAALRVIRRGSRMGVRLYDGDAPARRSFAGLSWFPVDPGYRLLARFEPHPEPRTVRISTIVGDVQEARVPGRAVFSLGGRELALLPTLAGERLFFVFRDATSGDSTYPAGRFLHADPPRDGVVILDFNRAHNPPCAYTDHATCPLPLPENGLAVPIPAGERRFRWQES